MYRALYRKWRPQRFEDVVGQQAVVTALKNQIQAGRVGHAYLFTGVRGTGKTTCAKIFARAVNCLDPQDGDPCGQCEICRGIENGSILDVVEMDAASNNGVDDIRILRDETAYTPSLCRYKVYIIDEVHMLSMPAFNALLKTLEEPPAHVLFILATTEIQKVPATILSRCQRYDFTRIQPEDIARRLTQVAAAEQLDLTPGAAELIARLADGALRDALSILDTCAGVAAHIDEELVRRMAGVTDKSYLFALSDAVAAHDGPAALAKLAALRQQSVDMKRLADELVGHYRNLMLASLPGGGDLLSGVSPGEEERYREKAASVPQAEAIRAIRTIGAALEKMARGGDQRIELELALFSLTEPAAPVFAAAPAAQPAPAAPKPFAAAQPAAGAAPAVQPFARAAQPGVDPPPAQSAADSPPWETAQPAAPDLPAAPPAQAKAPEAEDKAVQAAKPRTDPPAAAAQTAAAEPEEDPVPPPDDGDAPVRTGEALPWDAQETPPAEVPAPRAPAKPAGAGTPAPAARPGEAAAPQPFAPWDKVVHALEQRDPMLYAALKHSRAYYDGKRVLIDGGKMFRDFIRVNRDSQKLLKKVILETADITCGIGPYEAPRAQAAQHGNAEQALEALEKQGLDVVIRDTEKAKREK